MSAPHVPFLTTPLSDPDAEDTDGHPELTEANKVAIFDHVSDFVDWLLDHYPLCPTCIPELVTNYVSDVILPEEALTEQQNAPTSMALH